MKTMRFVDKFNLRKFGIILVLLGAFIPSILYPFTSLTPLALLARGLSLQRGVIYKTRISDLEILIKEGKPQLDPKENVYYFAGEYDDRLAIPYKYPFVFGIVLFLIGISLNANIRKVSLIGNRLFFLSVILLTFFSAAVGLYLIKNFLGIDLFPGVHVGRYLGL